MTDEPSRLRVIDGGSTPRVATKPVRRVKPSGKTETRRLHVCGKCNQSSLQRLRLGAWDYNGKLKGGEDWWCCAGCGTPYYRIRGYD